MVELGNIELQPIENNELGTLQLVSSQTFINTFGENNNKADIDLYVANAYNQNKLLAELKNKNSYFYFAKIDQQVVGYIKVNTDTAQTEYQFSDALEIERIYLIKDYQHQGIGEILLNYAIELAKAKGKVYIWLGVWEDNLPAQAFYRKHGFDKVDEHQFILGHAKQLDYIMRKDI